MGLKESGLRGSLGNVSVGIDAIPDTGLDYLWWGPEIDSISTYPDVQSNALDMSAVNTPTLGSINSRQAAVYQSSDADHHTVGSSLPLGSSNEWTVVVVYQATDDGNAQTLFQMGSDSSNFAGYEFTLQFNNNQYQLAHSGVDGQTGGTPTGNDVEVAVGTYDGSNIILDVNKTEVASGSVTDLSTPLEQSDIGQRAGGEPRYANASIGAAGHDATFSDATRRDELADIMIDEFNITI